MAVEVDLHCHSTRSDGSLTSQQLLDEAKRLGLKGIGLVDHDVLPDEELISLASSSSVRAICGIELHLDDCNDILHIIGYGVTHENYKIKKIIALRKERELAQIKKLVENLNSGGKEINFEKDVAARAKGRQAIYLDVFSALLEKKHFANFYEIKNYLDYAGSRIMPPIIYSSSEEFIQAIHSQNGIAVLAHPLTLNKQTRKQKIKQIVSLGIDGIELNYPYLENGYSPASFDESDFIFLRETIEVNHLLASGGSDFHGTLKGRVKMGCAGIGEKEFEEILKHLK